MSIERFPPDDPREWPNRARSSLARAHARSPDVYLEDLCFDAQQAVEKAIKGLLMKHAVAFPYVHDLALEEAGQEAPEFVREAEKLTRYAVITRYPGLAEPVTEENFEEAVATAEMVVAWAEEQIAAGSATPP